MKIQQVFAGIVIAIALNAITTQLISGSLSHHNFSHLVSAQAQAHIIPANIESAYREAVRTGEFRTHLSPYVHPTLQSDIDSHWLFRTEPADTESTINSTVRPVNGEDLALFEQYYQNYLEPTHVIEVEISQPWVTNGITGSTVPIYLKQTANGYYIVFGSELNTPQQIENSQAEQQLVYFQSSTDLWQHNWNLRFDQGEPYRYALQLRDTQSNTVLETFGIGDVKSFHANFWEIRFWLQPEGELTAYQALPQGGISLPYGYQIGRQSIASATSLPLENITQFLPHSDLSFVGDHLFLAQLIGRSSGIEKTLVIEVVRTALES